MDIDRAVLLQIFRAVFNDMQQNFENEESDEEFENINQAINDSILLMPEFSFPTENSETKLLIDAISAAPQEALAVCVICVDPIAEGELTATPVCGHLFHFQCLENWAKQVAVCPVCRANLPI